MIIALLDDIVFLISDIKSPFLEGGEKEYRNSVCLSADMKYLPHSHSVSWLWGIARDNWRSWPIITRRFNEILHARSS